MNLCIKEFKENCPYLVDDKYKVKCHFVKEIKYSDSSKNTLHLFSIKAYRTYMYVLHIYECIIFMKF